MKKTFYLSCLVMASIFNLSAQAYEGKGDVKINAGLNFYGYGTGINGAVDFGLNDWFSIGGGTSLYFSNPEKYNGENFFVYGRACFHLQDAFGLPEQWDVYPGINLGILGNEFGFGAHIGARYFFNDTWGMYAEIGNHGSIGVTLNL